MFGFLKRGREEAPPKAAPSVPPGVRVYAIGDIHGRLDLLDKLLAGIGADLAAHVAERSELVFLGDYVDRGPDSRGVIDTLLACALADTRVFLRGNHEHFLRLALSDPASFDSWRRYGGVETLHSYGVPVADVLRGAGFEAARAALAEKMPDAHVAFLDELRSAHTVGDYFFCHAGVRPGIPLEAQRNEDLLWIREDFLRSDLAHGKVVVHGHTPREEVDTRPNRVGIDTGAYLSGHLTCLVLEGSSRRLLQT